MSDTVLKICILGASGIGKTCFCQALSEQFIDVSDTVPVRIQELSRQVGQEHVRVQLWDVSGGQQSQLYWESLSKDVDGVMLAIDPSHPEQEQELEQLYLNFAQPNNLSMKQCMVIELTLGSSNTEEGWAGLRGKLQKLPLGQVILNTSSPEAGRQAANTLLERLMAGCVAQTGQRVEKAILEG